jgi:hypothetical protein
MGQLQASSFERQVKALRGQLELAASGLRLVAVPLWRDAKKARQYTAHQRGVHALAVILGGSFKLQASSFKLRAASCKH